MSRLKKVHLKRFETFLATIADKIGTEAIVHLRPEDFPPKGQAAPPPAPELEKPDAAQDHEFLKAERERAEAAKREAEEKARAEAAAEAEAKDEVERKAREREKQEDRERAEAEVAKVKEAEETVRTPSPAPSKALRDDVGFTAGLKKQKPKSETPPRTEPRAPTPAPAGDWFLSEAAATFFEAVPWRKDDAFSLQPSRAEAQPASPVEGGSAPQPTKTGFDPLELMAGAFFSRVPWSGEPNPESWDNIAPSIRIGPASGSAQLRLAPASGPNMMAAGLRSAVATSKRLAPEDSSAADDRQTALEFFSNIPWTGA